MGIKHEPPATPRVTSGRRATTYLSWREGRDEDATEVRCLRTAARPTARTSMRSRRFKSRSAAEDGNLRYCQSTPRSRRASPGFNPPRTRRRRTLCRNAPALDLALIATPPCLRRPQYATHACMFAIFLRHCFFAHFSLVLLILFLASAWSRRSPHCYESWFCCHYWPFERRKINPY